MPFLAKIRKIKMAAIFGEGNFFLKIAKSTLVRYSVGEKSKWPPFLVRGIFFENCQEYIGQILCGSKISMKSLYLTRLRRWKEICVLPFLAKIRKFKMAAILGEGKSF